MTRSVLRISFEWTCRASDVVSAPIGRGQARRSWLTPGAMSLLAALLVTGPLSSAAPFKRGDANGDQAVNLTDAVYGLAYLFLGGEEPSCLDAADSNDDGEVSITDAIYLLGHLFLGGPPLPSPAEGCGSDPTDDPLDCRDSPGCVQIPPPSLVAFSITPSGRGEHLIYDGPLGFRLGVSFVQLYGHGFDEVEEIVLSDTFGFESRLSRGSFTVEPEGAASSAVYDALTFHLHDHTNDVRLLFTDVRESLGVRVRGPGGLSNRVELPVSSEQNPPEIGAVINGVQVPVGLVTGPVALRYSLYEHTIDTSWAVDVEFTADGGDTWSAASEAWWDPDHDGTRTIRCGSLAHPPCEGMPPVGGRLGTFIWDACQDLTSLAQDAGIAGEEGEWEVRLRLRVFPDLFPQALFTHSIESPPFRYLLLEHCQEGALLAPVEEFIETFDHDFLEDTDMTTAFWGPPDNPGFLVPGPSGSVAPYGEGVYDLRLDGSGLGPFEGQAGEGRHYFVVDTDTLQIMEYFVLVTESPDGSKVMVENRSPVEFSNPGAASGEFHLASLTITEDTLVQAKGSKPLVIRLAGAGDGAPADAVVLQNDGILDLSGEPGEPSAAASASRRHGGAGGAGGSGGGRGGVGGWLITDGVEPRILDLVPAMAGDLYGGGAGETPGAVDPSYLTRVSTILGGPGGGGGHRLPGMAGDPGRDTSPQLQQARGGRGGPPRGGARQIVLTGGSGGGGGGASIYSRPFADFAEMEPMTGGGGGGGGGALRVVARGSVVVEGQVLALGGQGGEGRSSGSSRGVPGGGGSGGSIVIQASGDITVRSCDSLQVSGGLPGDGVQQNLLPGAGSGAPGWIRIDSESGVTPFCSATHAATILTGNLSSREDDEIEVESTQGFPVSGTVRIGEEEIEYLDKDDVMLLYLTRGARGTEAMSHAVGAPVVLVGVVLPLVSEVLEGGDAQPSGTTVNLGQAQDGSLYLAYVPVADPQGGETTSVYEFDTDTGSVTRLDGQVVLEAKQAGTTPGLLELSSLIIEEGATLKVTGEHPAQIAVAGEAVIAGVVDVSGGPGGPLSFTVPGTSPLPGEGGPAGPGGAPGGAGATITFSDGKPGNHDPANTQAAPADSGGLPTGLAGLDPPVAAATGGGSWPGRDCRPDCAESAAGGGGGGNLSEGGAGFRKSPVTNGFQDGKGGSAFGEHSISQGGSLHLKGGAGGGGGGASTEVSLTYSEGRIPGQYPFAAQALFAPGTGGAGGGGALRIAAAHLRLESTGQLLARGGDAYQSIDMAGNGGAGAGGSILIQVIRGLSMAPGGLIDVSGGKANCLPPLVADSLRAYEGNIRDGEETFPSEMGLPFGGPGGDGSPGRIRIEVPSEALPREPGPGSVLSTGRFLPEGTVSVAVSKTFRLGFGSQGEATSRASRPGTPRIQLKPDEWPAGSAAVVLWQGAQPGFNPRESFGSFGPPVEDPRWLEGASYARFLVYFLTAGETPEPVGISEISLPYSLLPE